MKVCSRRAAALAQKQPRATDEPFIFEITRAESAPLGPQTGVAWLPGLAKSGSEKAANVGRTLKHILA